MEPEPSPQAPSPAAPDAPDAPDNAPSRARSKRRRRHYDTGATFRRGRMWIALLFCAFRLFDVAVVLLINLLPDGYERRYLYLFLFLTGLWTTALLVAMWMRHAWARYVLVGLLLLLPVAEIFALPRLQVDLGNMTVDPVLAGSSILYACLAGLLVLLKPLRRLTSQSYT